MLARLVEQPCIGSIKRSFREITASIVPVTEHLFILLLAAKLLQSCLTLCNPIDGSPPGSPVPGIFQARTLEWVATSFSNAWKWKVKVKSLSHVRLFATPWIAAYQAPPSMGLSRQEYWGGVPLPSPIYTLPCATQTAAQHSALWWLSEVGWEKREEQEGRNICIRVADSLGCTAETQHYITITFQLKK